MKIKIKKLFHKICWKLCKFNRPPGAIEHNVPNEVVRNKEYKIKFDSKDPDHDTVLFDITKTSCLLKFSKTEDIKCDEEIIMMVYNVRKFVNKKVNFTIEAFDGKNGYNETTVSLTITK